MSNKIFLLVQLLCWVSFAVADVPKAADIAPDIHWFQKS